MSFKRRSLMSSVRFSALMTPAVTVPWNSSPIGLPMAMAGSPTTRSSELPNFAVGRSVASTFTTAMSVSSSAPTSVPLKLRPSGKETVISFAPWITWLFVTI